MRIKRSLAAISAAVLVVLGMSSPASASSGDNQSEGLTRAEMEAEGLRLDDQAVADEVNKILNEGGVILGVTQADYVADVSREAPGKEPGGTVSTMAYPAGCGLSVIMYRSGQSVRSSSVTSCAAPFTVGEMDNVIMFWAWLRWNVKASNTTHSGGGTSFVVNTTYNCPNTNSTEWRTETYGDLWRGSTHYMAAAYDIFDDGAQACGT